MNTSTTSLYKLLLFLLTLAISFLAYKFFTSQKQLAELENLKKEFPGFFIETKMNKPISADTAAKRVSDFNRVRKDFAGQAIYYEVDSVVRYLKNYAFMIKDIKVPTNHKWMLAFYPSEDSVDQKPKLDFLALPSLVDTSGGKMKLVYFYDENGAGKIYKEFRDKLSAYDFGNRHP